MPNDTTFDSFEKELNRLVESFGKRITELKQPGYAEAQLRDDFLNPFFRSLGWDMENRVGLIQKEREVEIESATQIGGGRMRFIFPQPQRGCIALATKRSNPVGVENILDERPRVARTSQPWAELRYPVGVKRAEPPDWAPADSEKTVLQSAVTATATGQQIDALVYEFYGLTEEESNPMEGGQ